MSNAINMWRCDYRPRCQKTLQTSTRIHTSRIEVRAESFWDGGVGTVFVFGQQQQCHQCRREDADLSFCNFAALRNMMWL